MSIFALCTNKQKFHIIYLLKSYY